MPHLFELRPGTFYVATHITKHEQCVLYCYDMEPTVGLVRGGYSKIPNFIVYNSALKLIEYAPDSFVYQNFYPVNMDLLHREIMWKFLEFIGHDNLLYLKE